MPSHWTFDFDTGAEAERFLEGAGFSVGRLQRGDPRGIMFGPYDVQKWRNLSEADRAGLHGTCRATAMGPFAETPVRVFIKSSAPPEAHEALYVANDRLLKRCKTTPR